MPCLVSPDTGRDFATLCFGHSTPCPAHLTDKTEKGMPQKQHALACIFIDIGFVNCVFLVDGQLIIPRGKTNYEEFKDYFSDHP